MAKYRGGLTKWFAEDWRDVKTGKPCGRSGKKDKGRPYPACRPASKARTAKAKKAAKRKTSSTRISWDVQKGIVMPGYHKGKKKGGKKK